MLQFFLTHSPKNVASPTNLNALNSSYTFLDGVGKDIQTKEHIWWFFLKNRGHQLTFLWMRHLNFHKMSVMRLRRRQNIQFLWTVYCVYVRRPSEKKNSWNIDFQLLMESIYFPSIIHGKLMIYLDGTYDSQSQLDVKPCLNVKSGWIQAFLEGDFRLLFRSHG